jgi:hypothetical protein
MSSGSGQCWRMPCFAVSFSLRFLVVVIGLMTAGERSARAQASMHFDSASVKPGEPGNVRGATFQFLPGGNLRIVNGTLKALIESAYDVRDFQILDATGWMAADRFDISAKSPAHGPATDPAENIKATRLRLQSLLADRFHLKVRREKRDLPEYALRLAKRGFPGAVLTNAASIFTVLEERLGLKLEPIKGAVDVVVVDHAERPSPD